MADNQAASPLMRLPTELRLLVLDHLLPQDPNNARTITFPLREDPTQPSSDPNQISLQAPEITPSRQSLHSYLSGICCVNHQFRIEFLGLLYTYALVLEISEHTFWPSGCDPCSILAYAESNTQRDWTVVLPGLDFARVRELRLVVEPTDYPGFWINVRNAVATLPWPQPTMKCLRIDIEEVLESMAHNPPDEDCIVAWEPAETTVGDVQDVLRIVGKRVICARRLEINLPGFVKGDEWLEERVRALREWVCGERVEHEEADGAKEKFLD